MSKKTNTINTRRPIKRHGMSGTSTHNAWRNMLQRCMNKRHPSYKNYGGRGISISKKWFKFKNFFSDMGEKPDGLTLERNNNALGYYKENCTWATRRSQARNRRTREDNKTGANGVYWYKQLRKYRALITVNYKTYHIGCFETLNQAIIARKQAEKIYWGKT